MLVFDNEFETVNFYEDRQLFESVWKKNSEKMVDADYRNEIVKQFAFIATKKFKYVFFDTLEFYFTIAPDTQIWNNEILVKHLHDAGVEKVGVAIAPDIFSEVSVEQTIEENSNIKFKTAYFKTKEEALEWFKN